jgi:hypothetical protein
MLSLFSLLIYIEITYEIFHLFFQIKQKKTKRIMTETVIKLKNVNKKFGNLTAVNNVSLEIKKGENKEEYVFEFYNEEKLKIKN